MPPKPCRRAPATKSVVCSRVLPAADGLLNLGREVLHAHGDSVETEARQHVEMGFAGHAGIDFDSHSAWGRNSKWRTKPATRRFELRRRKVGGRAAAQVKLRDLASPGQARGHQIEFAQQVLQVRLGYFPCGWWRKEWQPQKVQRRSQKGK